MKAAGKVIVLVIVALLALTALDSWVFHPAGRWQVTQTNYGLVKTDTTTGESWVYEGGSDAHWSRLPGGMRK